jgi:hypothetical protein
VEPEPEREEAPVLDLPTVLLSIPAPAKSGIHLMEPDVTAKKRRKSALWPTADRDDGQLSLFG